MSSTLEVRRLFTASCAWLTPLACIQFFDFLTAASLLLPSGIKASSGMSLSSISSKKYLLIFL